MDKRELRKDMAARRRAMPAADRAAASRAICAKILLRGDVRAAIEGKRTFAVYWAQGEEVNLGDLAEALRAAGVPFAAPRWEPAEGRYVMAESSGRLQTGRHGIREPEPGARRVPEREISVWIVPGLAFARDGARLGYGGGWYDRLLADAARDATVLGAAYEFQLVDSLPSEQHDIRVCDTITPG